MKFFIPIGTPETTQSQLDHMIKKGIRPVYSFTYFHDGDRIEVKVGSRRVVYSPKTGPRGGYIKNAELSKRGVAQGNVVDLIMEVNGMFETMSKPTSEWGPVSWAPTDSVLPGSVVYFDLPEATENRVDSTKVDVKLQSEK